MKIKISSAGKTLVFPVILLCVAALAARPEVYIKSSLEGLKLWALVVAPSLLPFFFLTALTSALGITEKLSAILSRPTRRLFNCGGVCSYAFLMSVLSGYPVGAKIISDLKKNGLITQSEATRASTFCSTSGPLFIIGSVGTGMFGNKKVGYMLIICHILSAIICGLIFRNYGNKTLSSNDGLLPNRSANALYESVYSSVISLAVVGGFICVFYVFADMAADAHLFFPLEYLLALLLKRTDIPSAFCSGLIECTRGCLALSKCGLSTYSVAFAAANISFGGVSVIAQSVAFLSSAKTDVKIFVLSKIIQTAISFCLALGSCASSASSVSFTCLPRSISP